MKDNLIKQNVHVEKTAETDKIGSTLAMYTDILSL